LALAGILLALLGRNLRRRRCSWYCFVVGLLTIPFFPVGTILGIYTIVLLNRAEARSAFRQDRTDVPQ
jgi:hypothetical protein